MNSRLLFCLLFLSATLAASCGGSESNSNSSDDTIDTTADIAGDDTGEDVSDDSDATDEEEDTVKVCGTPTGMRPGIRSEQASVFDSVGNQVVIHGGSKGVSMQCDVASPTFESDTWIYDVDCDDWRMLDPLGGPAGRGRHMAAFDSQEHRMILFGGRTNNGVSADLWALDLETDEWSRINADGPSARMAGMMVYDPAEHRVILFGGNTIPNPFPDGYNPLDDVWVLDLATETWTEISTNGGPAPRQAAGFLWDPSRNRMVVYGGNETFSSFFGDLWALEVDGTNGTWTQLATSGSQPANRFWGTLSYDADNDRYIMFGGHDDTSLGNRNDVWAYDPTADTWQELITGDTYNNPPTGQCDFPPDFATIAEGVPERREAQSMVTGPDGAYIYGGKTDCGVVDDLVRFNFSDSTFTELTTATVGELCERRGGVDCMSMCN